MSAPTISRRLSCFEDVIAAGKREGVDFNIHIKDRASSLVIVAPHGGVIEPGTSAIASAIAGRELSLYIFEGLAPNDHGDLHVTSNRFDEPTAVRLVENADVVIAIHGRKDGDDTRQVWIGGLDVQRCQRTAAELIHHGFPAVVREPDQTLSGVAVTNICNRGRSKAGVQLEIPRALRDKLHDSEALCKKFAEAVNHGMRERPLTAKY